MGTEFQYYICCNLICDAEVPKCLRVIKRPFIDRGTSELCTVRPRAEHLPDINREATDVCTAADMRANRHVWVGIVEQL